MNDLNNTNVGNTNVGNTNVGNTQPINPKQVTKKPKKKMNSFFSKQNNKQIVIVCIIGLSCLAIILGFLYSYYEGNNKSLFGSNDNSSGTGMTGFESQVPTDDSITDYVSPDTLLEWTEEAEDTLEEYVGENDIDDVDIDEEITNSDSSSNSNSDSSSNSSSDSSSNNNSNSDSSSNSSTNTTPTETLGKGEWLAKYYDGGVLRYYADGSVYDMTRNIWWTKTQWDDFMMSITQ